MSRLGLVESDHGGGLGPVALAEGLRLLLGESHDLGRGQPVVAVRASRVDCFRRFLPGQRRGAVSGSHGRGDEGHHYLSRDTGLEGQDEPGPALADPDGRDARDPLDSREHGRETGAAAQAGDGPALEALDVEDDVFGLAGQRGGATE